METQAIEQVMERTEVEVPAVMAHVELVPCCVILLMNWNTGGRDVRQVL